MNCSKGKIWITIAISSVSMAKCFLVLCLWILQRQIYWHFSYPYEVSQPTWLDLGFSDIH